MTIPMDDRGHEVVSLRDWFAGQALIAICGNEQLANCSDAAFPDLPTREAIPCMAFAFADGMIKAREVGNAAG